MTQTASGVGFCQQGENLLAPAHRLFSFLPRFRTSSRPLRTRWVCLVAPRFDGCVSQKGDDTWQGGGGGGRAGVGGASAEVSGQLVGANSPASQVAFGS